MNFVLLILLNKTFFFVSVRNIILRMNRILFYKLYLECKQFMNYIILGSVYIKFVIFKFTMVRINIEKY